MMDSRIAAAVMGLAALNSTAVQARPVPVGETPGHTAFFIDDETLRTIALPGGDVLQALIITKSPPNAQMTARQIGASSLMQFRCAEKTYRQWSTDSLRRDGTRVKVVLPDPARPFAPTRAGSFERRLIDAACAMKPRKS
ncbi:MAG: hypothetical protein JSR96_10870 [Proteobacteria bacterium]|nr:hypothetical protein [Pseudomonadota bacterium]